MTTPVTDTFRTQQETAASWSGVFAMAVCAFALIASEFLPVSLLTPMARDLNVTEGMTGQGIAISGAFAVFTSLFISALAGNLNRKTLLPGFNTSGYRSTFIASAALLAVCAVLTVIIARKSVAHH